MNNKKRQREEMELKQILRISDLEQLKCKEQTEKVYRLEMTISELMKRPQRKAKEQGNKNKTKNKIEKKIK